MKNRTPFANQENPAKIIEKAMLGSEKKKLSK